MSFDEFLASPEVKTGYILGNEFDARLVQYSVVDGLAIFEGDIILGTADRYRIVGPDAALAVGATIALCGLIALPVEGASMNPARSLGPAIVAGELGNVWIYVVGPIVGALLAVLITRLLHGSTESDGKAAATAGRS